MNKYNKKNNDVVLEKIYNLVPFAEETMDLSIIEKIYVLRSRYMIEALIRCISFSPKRINNHNFFYDDMQSDTGMIFDGIQWRKEKIETMLELMAAVREVDLLNIYKEIQPQLTPEENREIKQRIVNEIGFNLEPYGKDTWKHKVNNIIF